MLHPWLRLLDLDLFAMRQEAPFSRESQLRLAKALNARCRHREAMTILDHLISANHHHGDVWFERIVAEGDNGTFEELQGLACELESLREESPLDSAPCRNLGYVRILQQRPEDAELSLLQAIERNSKDARAMELMGLIYLRREEPVKAAQWFRQALNIHARDVRSLRLLGLACEQMGDHKGAESAFAAAVEEDPHYFWGWHSLGEYLIRLGELEDGLRCINKARSMQSRESASYFMLAELYSELGHMELAQAEMHTLMLLSPSQSVLAESYAVLGELRQNLGDVEGATSYFTLAAETDQDNPVPWVALGDLAREEQRLDDALRCYREALLREPDAADVHVQMGYVLLKLGKQAESELSFLSALESDEGEYSAYLGLAECYRTLKRPEEELKMVRKAMEIAPEDPDVWNSQGVALEVNGDLLEATEAYEKALALAPNHRKAANNLGFVLEKRMNAGQSWLRERAIDAWKRRLLICRDEGQSMRMAMEHLLKLGLEEETVLGWIDREPTVESRR